MTIIPADTPLPADPSSPSASPRDSVPTKVARTRGATGAVEPADKVEPRYRATDLLSSTERQTLARLARAGWVRCGAQEAGVDFGEWRHDQVAEATDGETSGLTSLRRGQYRDVEMHFAEIAGDSARAFRAAGRSGQGQADRDLALAKLRQACTVGDLAYPEYPEAICRNQFKCSLDQLETGKVWFLFYTCTRAARRKNEKAAEIAAQSASAQMAVPTLDERCGAENPTGEPGETPQNVSIA
jgi:hypothetical protein